MTVIEASNRLRLAQILVRAISSVQTVTEDLQLLPARAVLKEDYTVEPTKSVTANKSKRLDRTAIRCKSATQPENE